MKNTDSKSTIANTLNSYMVSHKKTVLLLCLNVTLTSITLFALVFRPHFASDSYFHMFAAAETYTGSTYLSRAGYTSAIIRWIQLSFGSNIVLDQNVTYIIAIICTAIAVTLLTRLFVQFMKRDTLPLALGVNFASAVVFINPYIVELMLFPECAIFVGAGNLLTALSVWFLAKKKLKSVLLSALFLILALGAYQAYLGIYFAASSFVMWLESREKTAIKPFVMNWLLVFGIGIFAALFQVVFMKVYAVNFVPSNTYGTTNFSASNVTENIVMLVKSQPHFIGWMLGKKLVIPFCIMVGIMIILLIFTLRNAGLKNWLTFLFALATSYICVFAIHTIAEVYWVPLRSVFGIYAVMSCFLLLPSLLLCNGKNMESAENICRKNPKYICVSSVAAVLSAALFLTVSMVVTDLSTDNTITIQGDAQAAKEINTQIAEYEEETGVAVTTISIAFDESPSWNYPGVRYTPFESNSKALMTSWGLPNILVFYGGDYLEYEDMDAQIYKQYFEGKDWDSLNLDQQLVFIDSHVYLCHY